MATVAELEARIAALEAQEGGVSEVLVPNYLSIDPTTGQVSATFSGFINAAGIKINNTGGQTTLTPDNAVSWYSSQGALIAQVGAYDYPADPVGGTPAFSGLVLKGLADASSGGPGDIGVIAGSGGMKTLLYGDTQDSDWAFSGGGSNWGGGATGPSGGVVLGGSASPYNLAGLTINVKRPNNAAQVLVVGAWSGYTSGAPGGPGSVAGTQLQYPQAGGPGNVNTWHFYFNTAGQHIICGLCIVRVGGVPPGNQTFTMQGYSATGQAIVDNNDWAGMAAVELP